MEDEFNNIEIGAKEQELITESPNMQNKPISTRKRKQLINKESDEDEDILNNNIPLQKIQKEESKEQETIQNRNKNIKSNYKEDKFNTMDINKMGGTTVKIKDNSFLQEKLKKIFLNRDKLKFQYSKQDIPDNLKYHSDDSETSEKSGFRKSKITKANNTNNINAKTIPFTNRQSRKFSNINNDFNNENNINNQNNNELKIADKDLELITPCKPTETENINVENKNSNYDINSSQKKNENENSNYYSSNKKQISEEKRKLSSYNEEEKTKSNEKNSSNKYERDKFKYNNKWNNNEEEKEKEEEKELEKEEEKVEEQNDINEKESTKKNVLLKMFEKMDKQNENNEIENKENKNKDEQNKERKQKLLKKLFGKKDSNTIENNEDENKELSPKNQIEIEKENRRRRIIEQIKTESNNPTSNKKNKYYEKSEEKSNKKETPIKETPIKETPKKESPKKEDELEWDKENEENIENEEDEHPDKGTYLSNKHKNKLTISIKQKSKLLKHISSSSLEDKTEKKEKEKDNNNINNNEDRDDNKIKQNKKTNALLDILEKLKKKKSEEQIISDKLNNEEFSNFSKKESREEFSNYSKKESKEEYSNNKNKNIDDDINESEIEREAERIRRKEKKKEEKRMAKEKEKQKNKNPQINTNIDYNFNINKKDRFHYTNKRGINNKDNYNVINTADNATNKDNEIKREEIKRRKQLEEDLRAEINDYNKEDDSTVNNTSKSNIISSNTQVTQLENEDKSKKKEFETKPNPTRNTMGKNKNIVDEGAAPNEIILNDMPKGYMDRSFDSGSTYMKRKISNGRNTLNIYRPKRAEIKEKSPERNINALLENNSNSFNPNNIINYNNLSKARAPFNYQNKAAYIKKKSSFNDNNNFALNNRSFYQYTKDDNQNLNNNNLEIELGGGGALNSSFDTYMQMNINNNNRNNYLLNSPKNNYYEINPVKKNYNKSTHNPYIPANNLKYTNSSINNNNYYKKGVVNNNDVNRSFGYINNNNFNNDFNNNHNINNNNIKNNDNNYNNLINKTNAINVNKSPYLNNQKKQFVNYSNNSYNPNNPNYYNNNPLKTYNNQLNNNIQNDNYNNYYQNSPKMKKNDSNRKRGNINNDNYNNYNNYNNNSQYTPNYEKDTSINIEDLMVLEEKLNEIIIALNKNHSMHNECFEFWNYYFNCSFYGKLEKLFKNENDSINVQISINHILISVMICYDFSFEMEVLNNEYSILVDILELNHRNLIIIYEHILSKISSESKSNLWVHKLNQLVNIYNKMDDSDYISMNGRKLSPVEKITYNVTVIVQNIRVLLKNYRTKRIEYLTSIFKKINDKTYEEINSYFRDNILRVDNVNGSVLASVFLKENEYFQTEPAPYIKTKNRKKYSLILDLDETLVHFKINNEDDSEGVLQIRPGVIPFLELVGKYYELIVFTAATQDYGDLLIDAIEENNLYFEHRFYRQHTVIIGNDFVKDLNRIGRPIDKMIIVDNMPQNFRLQKENGINIKAFWGEDANDNALEELGKILINIAKDGGDVRIGLEKYRDEIVKKVTSNISKNNY